MDFSEKIKKYREDNNLTQEQLGKMLNVSRQAISKWETGSSYPNYDILLEIGKLLNESVDDLLSKREIVFETINNKSNGKLFKAIGFSLIGITLLTFSSVLISAISNRNVSTSRNAFQCNHDFGEYSYNNDDTCFIMELKQECANIATIQKQLMI